MKKHRLGFKRNDCGCLVFIDWELFKYVEFQKILTSFEDCEAQGKASEPMKDN